MSENTASTFQEKPETKKNPIFCKNCGKYGHFFYQCMNPITSIGIIAFRYLPLSHTAGSTTSLSGAHLTTRRREYLIIRRKDTLGYIDFIRGKYSVNNKGYILNMFKQMTCEERSRILLYAKEEMNKDYRFQLWHHLWNHHEPQTHDSPPFHYSAENGRKNYKSTEEKISKDKFMTLAYGMNPYHFKTGSEQSFSSSDIGEKKYYKFQKRHPFSLQSLVKECEDHFPEWTWKEQEWGFPKGRRDSQENDFLCGLREFTEETGYYKNIPLPWLSACVSRKENWNGDEKLRILSRNDSCFVPGLSEDISSCRFSKMTAVLNVFPFEENFIGSNYKPYKHKYYLMQMDYDNTVMEHQTSEVSVCVWKTYEECMEMFRFYNEEKKQMLTRVHRMLDHFDLIHVRET